MYFEHGQSRKKHYHVREENCWTMFVLGAMGSASKRSFD